MHLDSETEVDHELYVALVWHGLGRGTFEMDCVLVVVSRC
jgi:hypothetical protein